MTRFVRNPDYWGEPAHLDAVEFYIYTDGELAAGAMAAGDIDVMGTSNVNAILTLRALDDVVLYETDDYEESFAMANSSRPPFDDIRARKALTYAFARDDYVEFIGAGVLRAADQASTPESMFYNPDVVQEHDTPDCCPRTTTSRTPSSACGTSLPGDSSEAVTRMASSCGRSVSPLVHCR